MTDARSGRQRRRLTATVTDLEVVRQRAYLVGVMRKADDGAEAEASLSELGLLTDTAGSEPIAEMLVRRDKPDPAMYVGKGKAREIATETKALDIDVVVFDNELSPAQQRNLQQLLEVDVVDRVALILDIFAQHATSREGMVQVELAQHRYRLPRLRGRGTELSRLGGGIGTRGPGETKLETDRRRILERISKLERELKDLGRSRATRSKARNRTDLPVVSLVGYTNAGKSTLFNYLTDAGVLVEDQLFATLDSTVRRSELPNGRPVLFSDTVGFVRRLPHELVEAFRSTLEEVNQATLLLHIVDAADPNPDRQIDAVRKVLRDIGAGTIDEQLVINKTDIAEPAAVERLQALHPDALAVSAVTGAGVDELLEALGDQLEGATVEVDLTIPYERGDVVAALHDAGEVIAETHTAAGTEIRVKLPKADADRYAAFS
ncbi:MAG TPA: GTPase HflX [Acidimicrobiia bacterium]|jgi:GTP-binding protein HflX|nr:GTPase HflX [Acidimicrobiia bacterium]